MVPLRRKFVVYCLTELQSDRLRELAARMTFKGLTTDEVVTMANTLLNAGVYDDSLLAIIDTAPAILADVVPLFRRFLTNASILVPEYETSVWQLLYFHIRRIAETPHDPLHTLNDLINEVYYTYRCDHDTGDALRTSYGIGSLIGDYWLKDDLLDCQSAIFHDGKTGSQLLNELRESTQRDARAWLERYTTDV